MIRLSFTIASVTAVLHDGINSENEKIHQEMFIITTGNLPPPGLSFTMASVPAALHDGISSLKMKIYIKKCTSLRLVII